MRRLKTIQSINEGQQMVCLAGAGINDLAQEASALDRESHSVLGSMFLNPSVAAGIAFSSGGTQLRKGPVFTDRLLYAMVDAQGKVQVVDTLGLGPSDTALYHKLEQA